MSELQSAQTLQEMRVVVTGSSSGIGRAIALSLAQAGADVIVHCRRSHDAGEEVVRQIRQLGRQSELMMADLHDPSDCDRLVADAWQRWGRVDAWINNAGADILTGEGFRLSFEEKMQWLLGVDVAATIRLSRDIGQRMKEAGGGVILNMGWDQAETGFEGDSGQLFTAAKAAVMAFTKSLALSLAPEVRVNCLAPGWIRTKWGQQTSSRWQKRAIDETPLGRWGDPQEVAAVARFLCSPESSFITGQVIRINGGAVR